jgi:phytoene/squalene synthetase
MSSAPNDGWVALRAVDRELACCLLFTPSASRGWLADLLSLLHELESAVRIPSEPMLAAIRLQWWVDAVVGNNPAAAPLVWRLHHHLADGRMQQDKLVALIGIWQDRLQQAPDEAPACWAQAFSMLMTFHARADLDRVAATIGHVFAGGAADAATMPDLADMRRICDADTRWLFLLACMLRRGLDGAGAADDSLLVWRMLVWRWGVRLPS